MEGVEKEAGGESEKSIREGSSGAGTGRGGCDVRGKEDRVGLVIVVTRASVVVSADGGGGREARTEARQRKHSPLPK